jgi:hypothetical protein
VARFDPVLMARLREAAEIIAEDARMRSARWSRRVPASVRLQGGTSSVTVAAGGKAAPQAWTMEGNNSGTPRRHPVFGTEAQLQAHLDAGGRGRHGHGWTWVSQPPRPFMKEAIEAKAEEAFRQFAKVVEDWAHEKGFK